MVVVGGGLVFDVVKVMWFFYEYLDLWLDDFILLFFDLCKCVVVYLEDLYIVWLVVILMIVGMGLEVLFVVVISVGECK